MKITLLNSNVQLHSFYKLYQLFAEQSFSRAFRMGQRKETFIYRFVAAGTMEDTMYKRSVTKQALRVRVLEAKQVNRPFKKADLSELYK